jgi:hypothetical protein
MTEIPDPKNEATANGGNEVVAGRTTVDVELIAALPALRGEW